MVLFKTFPGYSLPNAFTCTFWAACTGEHRGAAAAARSAKVLGQARTCPQERAAPRASSLHSRRPFQHRKLEASAAHPSEKTGPYSGELTPLHTPPPPAQAVLIASRCSGGSMNSLQAAPLLTVRQGGPAPLCAGKRPLARFHRTRGCARASGMAAEALGRPWALSGGDVGTAASASSLFFVGGLEHKRKYLGGCTAENEAAGRRTRVAEPAPLCPARPPPPPRQAAAMHECRSPVCVLCRTPATIYCRNDDAFLCADCDRQVHLTSSLAAPHVRVPTPPAADASGSAADPSASTRSPRSEQLR